jgi:hypothetical protein
LVKAMAKAKTLEEKVQYRAGQGIIAFGLRA